MERWLFTFFIGAILSLFLPIVPDFSHLLFCLFFAVIFCFFKRLRSFSGLFFGCAWLLSAGFSYQNIWKANNLTQDDFVGKTITIKGFVTNIPTTLSRHVKDGSVERKVSRFNFTVDEVNQRKLTEKINIRLRWDDKPLSDEIISHIGIIEQGQRWQLKVRIKPGWVGILVLVS